MRFKRSSATVNLQDLEIERRLDRIPVYPWPKSTLLLLGLSFLFAAFDIQDIGSALPRASADFHVGLGQLSIVASLGLVGYIIGEVIIGFVSDLYGRRTGLVLSLCVVAGGSLGTALAPGVAVLDGFRLVSGMGIGACIAVVTTYLSELPPAAIRGRYAGWTLCTNAGGLFLATVVAFGLVPSISAGWRVLLAVPVVALVIALFVARMMPESPRWLVERGRTEEAGRLVTAAERRARVMTGAELPPVPVVAMRERSSARFAQLIKPPQLKWTVLVFIVWFANYLPAYGLISLGTTVLGKAGYTLQESIGLSIGGAAAGVVGALLVPHMSDRLGRKYPASAISVIAAVLWILLAVRPSAATVILAYIAFYMQLAIFSGLIYTATAEHFPTETRNVGIGFADGLGHVGGAIAPLVGTAVFVAFGGRGFFVFFGALFIVLGLVVLLMRNTQRRQLEELRAAPAVGVLRAGRAVRRAVVDEAAPLAADDL
jgi:MFS transporter, putative metabolite:H+ symporter